MANESHLKSVSKRDKSLDKFVQDFVAILEREFPSRIGRRPTAFKSRTVALLKLRMPPYPKPAGRPKDRRITEAVEIYTRQVFEVEIGVRKKLDWVAIGSACIAGFGDIKSQATRTRKLARLRNAVRRRLDRLGIQNPGLLDSDATNSAEGLSPQ